MEITNNIATQIKELKDKTELSIRNAIIEFEENTGLKITGSKTFRSMLLNGKMPVTYIELEIEL